jgi:hypothetical protein
LLFTEQASLLSLPVLNNVHPVSRLLLPWGILGSAILKRESRVLMMGRHPKDQLKTAPGQAI